MSHDRIPFIVYGDGPRQPSGLARIARDLSVRLYSEAEELGIRFAQVGVDEPHGWHFQAWDFFGFQPRMDEFGRGSVEQVVNELQKETGERPTVLAIFDPSRVYDLTRYIGDGEEDGHLSARIWGYFPIDAENPAGQVGGPAASAVCDVDRVLAYGTYGAGVLQKTLQAHYNRRDWKQLKTPAQARVAHLPHGIDTRVFTSRPLTEADPLFQKWHAALPEHTVVVGCVATNQPRKDFGLLFSSVARLRQLGWKVALWLHTDFLTKTWDVGELALQCAFGKRDVLVTTGEIPDHALAARYTASTLTLAPGLGEGFGYPIVESLACGTPVAHGKYAGGIALIPREEWLFDATAWRLESVYALLRPVFHPNDAADVMAGIIRDVQVNGQEIAAFCRGSVAHLDWQYLWPAWRGWIRQGLHDARRRSGSPRHGTGPGYATRQSRSQPDAGADDPRTPGGGSTPAVSAHGGGDPLHAVRIQDAVSRPGAPPEGGGPGVPTGD